LSLNPGQREEIKAG